MSTIGIGAFTLGVIFAACLLGYAWGWRDAKAQTVIPPSTEGV